MLSEKDREILRALASKQMELHKSPENLSLIKEWYRHNSCIKGRPIIHMDITHMSNDVIIPLLKCCSPDARKIEFDLYKCCLNFELFGDDWPVPGYFPVLYGSWINFFGFDTTGEKYGDSIAMIHPVRINNLEAEADSLGETVMGIDRENARRIFDVSQDVFGDILPPKFGHDVPRVVPTRELVYILGMEKLCYSLYDCPDKVHQIMERITDGYYKFFDFLSGEGLIFPTTSFEMVRQSSLAFNLELPDENVMKSRPLTSHDIWGYMDSQESVSISPEMFSEFFMPYYKKLSELFAFLSYGCCEPVSKNWDICLHKFENLRKVSISAWCDEEYMGERLAGKKIIFQRKLPTEYLSQEGPLDEEGIRKCLCKTLNAAKGCQLEITQMDVYSLKGDYEKIRRYVELIRHTIEERYCQ